VTASVAVDHAAAYRNKPNA